LDWGCAFLGAIWRARRAGRGDGAQAEGGSLRLAGMFAGIAREGIGHLITAQHLLLPLRLPLNFDWEDMPPSLDLYLFHLVLGLLTQKRLARDVVAESRVEARGSEEILALASDGGTIPINHRGVPSPGRGAPSLAGPSGPGVGRLQSRTLLCGWVFPQRSSAHSPGAGRLSSEV
jgi:hypothetical protein